MGNRTVYCGRVSKDNLEQPITLQGWVQKKEEIWAALFLLTYVIEKGSSK